MSYTAALEQGLFPDMGLRSTWVTVPEDAMECYAYGSHRKTDLPIRVSPGVLDAEAYGVKSTARDIVHVDAPKDVNVALNRTRQGQARTSAYIQNLIWEQYTWPADLEQLIEDNSYAYILKPQPMQQIVPPLPPQEDVILSKTGSTNGFGSYIALFPGENLGWLFWLTETFQTKHEFGLPMKSSKVCWATSNG